MTRDTIRNLMKAWTVLCLLFVAVSVLLGGAGQRGDPAAGACCGMLAFGPALAAWVVGMVILGLASLMMPPTGPVPPRDPMPELPPDAPPPMLIPTPAAGRHGLDNLALVVLGALVFGFLAYQIFINLHASK